MFYCDPCAEARNWPQSFYGSWGNCEICGTRGICNDIPSGELPEAEEGEEDE